MKGISKSPARRNNDGFHRYLKPGALAQIRNSRIISRSNSIPSLSLSPERLDSVSPSSPETTDQTPDLLRKIYGGPCRIGRKKLEASRRSVLMTIINLNTNYVIESVNGNSNDVLIAH
ncbi:unnamed protein product [Cochlearia groenlandica]